MGSSHESPVPNHEVAFAGFFRTATGLPPPAPYDYQRRLAGDPTVADAIVDVPKSLRSTYRRVRGRPRLRVGNDAGARAG